MSIVMDIPKCTYFLARCMLNDYETEEEQAKDYEEAKAAIFYEAFGCFPLSKERFDELREFWGVVYQVNMNTNISRNKGEDVDGYPPLKIYVKKV